MQSFVVLALGFALANGQAASFCDGTCLYPATNPPCKQVTIDPEGVDAWASPYYSIFSSALSAVQGADSRCSTYFKLSNGLFLLISLVVKNDGSYIITKSLRADISGSPGCYRLEGFRTNDVCTSCVYNDFTLSGLNATCKGVHVLYRCVLNEDCSNKYSDTVILALSSALSPVSPCCQSSIASLAQQQGLGSLPLYYFPNKLGRRCITRFYGMTAINADCVDLEVALEINEESGS